MEPMVNIALRAARNAGRIILRAMDRVDTLTIEEKGRNDLVSEIDRQAEDVIVETILRVYPEHGVLGEEHGERAPDAEYKWVIDPLDGTTNFLHGIPHFCTSIAVTRGAALLHGVVVDHVRNEEFTASRGAGALRNGRRIRVANRDRLDDAVVAGGLPFASVAAHLDAYSHVLRSSWAMRTLRRKARPHSRPAFVAPAVSVWLLRDGETLDMAGGRHRSRSRRLRGRCRRRRPVHGHRQRRRRQPQGVPGHAARDPQERRRTCGCEPRGRMTV